MLCFNFRNIKLFFIIVLRRKRGERILKKKLNITFVNPNTEEQIVQAMCGVIAYNLSESNQKLKFDYSYIKKYQDSHITDVELE